MEKKWCMCIKLDRIARDGFSTCSICGGRDAYGLDVSRPPNAYKVKGIFNAGITTNKEDR